jgi:hypothetical protein
MLASRRFDPPAIPPSVALLGVLSSTSATKSSGTTQVITPTTGAPAGSKVTLTLQLKSGSSTAMTISSITDSVGNTWTVDATKTATSNYATAVVASSNLTTALATSTPITLTVSTSFVSGGSVVWCLTAWSFPTATGVDTSGTGVAGDTTTGTVTLAATTTQRQDLVLVALGWQSSPGTVTGPNGYLQLSTYCWYSLPGADGKFSATFSWVNSENAALCLVAYLP